MVLGRLGRGAVQPTKLPLHFPAGLLAQLQGGEALPELVQLVPLAFLAQLLADLLHLLPQEHLPLTFSQLLLDLGLDVLLGVEAH